jgi:hypothetical protein
MVALVAGCCGASARPAAAPSGELAGEARSLDLGTRCDLIGDILTFPVPSSAGSWTPFEDEVVRRLAVADEKLVVAAVVQRSPGALTLPLFGAGERCGERLALQSGGGSSGRLEITLVPRSPEGFDWTLALTGVQESSPSPMLPLSGSAHRRERSWRLEIAKPGVVRARRPVDLAPRRIPLAKPLPSGRAEAFLEFDTGGDIMGAPAKEAGLVLVVRHGGHEWRQTIASCAQPARGNALGDVAGDHIDQAECDGHFEIVAAPGAVRVERSAGSGAPITVTTVPLPDPKARAVVPRTRE